MYKSSNYVSKGHSIAQLSTATQNPKVEQPTQGKSSDSNACIGLTKNIETGKASWSRREISSNASKRRGTWNKSTVMKKQESTCLCNFYAQRPGESNETNKSQTTVKDLCHALVLQLALNAPASTSGTHVYSSF